MISNQVMLYVDPLSSKSIELGTEQYPYKSLDFAMLEIYSSYSLNTSILIEVDVASNWSIDVSKPFLWIINLGALRIRTSSQSRSQLNVYLTSVT